VAKDPLPAGLLPIVPELEFEVRLPSDRWSDVHVKVAEYLHAGVQTVCVLDDETKTIHAFHADRASQIFKSTDDLTVPEILQDFSAPVSRFFE